jgi:hypothetical protein
MPRQNRWPTDFPVPTSPWEWATSICIAARNLDLEIMPAEVAVESEAERELLELRHGRAIPFYGAQALHMRDALLEALKTGHGVHFAIPDLGAYAPEYDEFFARQLAGELDQLYPFGWKHIIHLWVSGSSHHYQAHVDLVDGLVFQLEGTKQIRVWPLAPEFKTRPIIQFSFQEERHIFRAGKPEEFTLGPGDVLLLPWGHLHDVRIPEGERSVAMTFSAGAPYPLLELCLQLNEMAGTAEAFTLPESMSYVDKFRTAFLNPNIYAASNWHGVSEMPAVIKEPLLELLRPSRPAFSERISPLLDQWWRGARGTRPYPGTNPRAMSTTDKTPRTVSLSEDLAEP